MHWNIEDGQLVKEFTFKNFTEAVGFVDRIVPVANGDDHHPDILVHSYKKVKIFLMTHSENKITEKDHVLASKIDALYETSHV